MTEKPDPKLGPGSVTILNPRGVPPVVEPSAPASEGPRTPEPNPTDTKSSDPQPSSTTPSPKHELTPCAVPPQQQPAMASPALPAGESPSPAPQSAAGMPLPSSANPAGDGQENQCANCGTRETPLWRRGLKGEIMCNACGLYVKSRNISRPMALNRTPQTRAMGEEATGTCPGGGQCNGMGGSKACSKCPTYNNRLARSKPLQQSEQQLLISCQNCGTVTTPLWRRDNEGNTICNACGLYLRMHHEHRPVQMLKNTIKRRKRASDSDTQTASPPQTDAKPAPHNAKALPLRYMHSAPPPVDFTHEQPVHTPPPVQPAGVPAQGVAPPVAPVAHPVGHPVGHPVDPAAVLSPAALQPAQAPPPPGMGMPLAALPLPPVVGGQPPDRSLYQPLSLLSYLSGDSKKEYLLAVRRQLQDKAAHCEAQLRQYVEYLNQCDDAVKQLD